MMHTNSNSLARSANPTDIARLQAAVQSSASIMPDKTITTSTLLCQRTLVDAWREIAGPWLAGGGKLMPLVYCGSTSAKPRRTHTPQSQPQPQPQMKKHGHPPQVQAPASHREMAASRRMSTVTAYTTRPCAIATVTQPPGLHLSLFASV
jgi:hypothetical protein